MELDNLKTQIQPHFLFNTLNSIYALAVRQDEKTADVVVQLSEFLRYVIKDARDNLVALKKEIDYISNYIDLQKARLRETVVINYTVSGDPMDYKIAPLILFSFIENAFQHGVSPEEESKIDIDLSVVEKEVRLYVYNKKVTISDHATGLGIGMNNARKRLELLYPDQHRLKVTETDKDYAIDLTISIQ